MDMRVAVLPSYNCTSVCNKLLYGQQNWNNSTTACVLCFSDDTDRTGKANYKCSFFKLGYFVFQNLTKCACMIPLTNLVAISCGITSCILKVKVTVLCLLDSSWHSTTPPPLPKESTINRGPRSLTVLRRFVPGLLERFSGSVSVVGTGTALCVSVERSRSPDVL